jgi:LysM repeat protein
MSSRIASVAFLVAFAFAAFPGSARADVIHVVGRGHTLEAIANRYHVTQKSIIDANKLKDVKRLKPGSTLIIPGVSPKKGAAANKKNTGATPGKPATAQRPKPAAVHAPKPVPAAPVVKPTERDN